MRFIVSGSVGLAFFLLPVPWQGRLTVPFDIAVRRVTDGTPTVLAVYCLTLIMLGAVATVLARTLGGGGSGGASHGVAPAPAWRLLSRFRTTGPLAALRLLGAPLAVIYFFRFGPEALLQPSIADLMWNTLVFNVGVIIPIGAVFLLLFVRYGFLEFVGVLMRPVMRPAFRLPGRSALDSLTSWVGSYSVGLYLTRQLFREGYYNRRETYTIVTCFSTVSIGFVAVVVQTLDLLHLFTLICIIYFISIYLLTAILARTWPIARVREEYFGVARREADTDESRRGLWQEAWRRGMAQAEGSASVLRTLRDGLTDGVLLASTILGSILAVGTAALLLAQGTPLFEWLGSPFVPLLSLLGIPDAEIVGPAVLVGITEMYIPALLVTDAELSARFFVALLSITQLIFFSSLGPMVLDMFQEVPVRAWELAVLFLIRTAILVPLLALVTAALGWAGIL
ncbi:MAG: YjiH family protein [Gemmatimonadales bacterium]|jgi:nucleoside recognition membrane protein YjiH